MPRHPAMKGTILQYSKAGCSEVWPGRGLKSLRARHTEWRYGDKPFPWLVQSGMTEIDWLSEIWRSGIRMSKYDSVFTNLSNSNEMTQHSGEELLDFLYFTLN